MDSFTFTSHTAGLQVILATIPDFVVMVDRDGRILYINRVEEDRTMTSVVGTDAREFMDPDSREAFDSALRSIWSDSPADPFDTAVPISGGMNWFRNRILPVRQDGRLVAALLIAHDITDLKAAERERDQMRRLLPVCAWCDRIQGEDAEWQSIEVYLKREQGTDVSHGLCPNCAEDQFGPTPTGNNGVA